MSTVLHLPVLCFRSDTVSLIILIKIKFIVLIITDCVRKLVMRKANLCNSCWGESHTGDDLCVFCFPACGVRLSRGSCSASRRQAEARQRPRPTLGPDGSKDANSSSVLSSLPPSAPPGVLPQPGGRGQEALQAAPRGGCVRRCAAAGRRSRGDAPQRTPGERDASAPAPSLASRPAAAGLCFTTTDMPISLVVLQESFSLSTSL